MTRRNVRERGKQVEKCDRSWRLEVTYNPYFTYPQDENRPPLPFPSLPWPWPAWPWLAWLWLATDVARALCPGGPAPRGWRPGR